MAYGRGIRHLQDFDAGDLVAIPAEFRREYPALRHGLLLLQEDHVLPGEGI